MDYANPLLREFNRLTDKLEINRLYANVRAANKANQVGDPPPVPTPAPPVAPPGP